MDLLIPNSWLKKYLNTKATPGEIAKYLSLCGPSVERINKSKDGDSIYSIEITSNRVDSASVLGIAREACAILPRFGIKASLKKVNLKNSNFKFVKKVKYLNVRIDKKLCPRFTAVLIKDVTIKDSDKEIKTFLEKVGVRPINNIVDVSNFVMHELGQPVHTFDYDKINGKTMILRESKKGEVITTLDNKTFELNGGDIVIEDKSGKLIDLCGIMGAQNSAIDDSTKNVLLFVQNYNQHKIRKTSMTLGQRTEAAVLFEKGLDSENISQAILECIDLIEKSSAGQSEKEILDIYPEPYKTKIINVQKSEIDKIIGIEIDKKDIKTSLNSLGFVVKWDNDLLNVKVPSWRNNDILIAEDIAEEIARIYGYHNLPCVLMNGDLPKIKPVNNFSFENNIRQILKALGANEIYNLSLVKKEEAGNNAIRLKNPLGSDTEYLRTNLMPSLVNNLLSNPQETSDMHFFEIANCYISRNNDLPQEKLTLAGIIKRINFNNHLNGGGNYYRKNKGIVETLLDELNIDYELKLQDGDNYLANQRLEVYSNKKVIGEFGNLEAGYFYYQFDMTSLSSAKKIDKKFEGVAKFPAQIEDITLTIPDRTYIGDVIKLIKSSDSHVSKIELKDVYQNNYTFTICYQAKDKTLTDIEVTEIRTKFIKNLKSKLGVIII